MKKNANSSVTILVSGASGVVGYGILKSLRRYNPSIRLIGITIHENSIAHAFCDVFAKALRTDDAGYFDWLRGVIASYAVDMIIPGIEADVIAWNRYRSCLKDTGAYVLLNNSELIELCADKWMFHKKLVSLNPQLCIDSMVDGTFEDLTKYLGLPFILKPRRGFGSKGIVKVENLQTFEQYKQDYGSRLMAQSFIGKEEEEEYTTSAFFDGNSSLIASMTLKRILSSQGFTEKAQVVDMPKIEGIIKELALIFRPTGPTNFQFRCEKGKAKLLEINPRISSATSIRTAFGYNESAMSVEYYLEGNPIFPPITRRGYAVRYVEDFIFYDRNNI